jgi:ubiquinone biosynthesis protein
MNLTSLPQLARNANRLREIVTILSKYGLADWVSRLHLGFARGLFKGPEGQRLSELTTERRIRLSLSELGTTFIKFGQMLSTRPDLVGPRLAEELTQLQDNVPADPPQVVRATIEKELGAPIAELFAEFEDRPIASASIGQVHRAALKDGRRVVLKVQHPGTESRVRNDLDILLGLAELAEQQLPEFRPYQPRATAAEFQRVLLRELDYRREGRYLQQFAVNFADDPTVHFPAPHPELSTSRVLTMEQLEGTKVAETSRLESLGVNREDVARRGAEIYLEMIFRDGFYHADPHPGNILILPEGVIGMLDCGMVGRLDDKMREDVEDMLAAIANRDPIHLTFIITRVGSIPLELDQAGLSGDIADLIAYYGGMSLDQLEVGKALTEVTEIIRRYHILLPTSLALLLKVLIMLEGTSRLLNPRFNLTELLEPYFKKLFWRRLSPARHLRKARQIAREWEAFGEMLPRGVSDVLQKVQTGRVNVNLEHKGLEPSVNRLVLGMLTSALFVGSAVMWSREVPPLIAGVSVFGSLGCVISVALGLRLLWAIRKSGHLDRKG